VLDYVDGTTEQIVVLTKFRATAQEIATKAESCALYLGGSTPDQFNAWLRKERRVLVGTIAAMGASMNLQQAGSMILVDQEWSSLLMRQAEDRIHRLGITETKDIIYVYSPGSIDELVLSALDRKMDIHELVDAFLAWRSDYVQTRNPHLGRPNVSRVPA